MILGIFLYAATIITLFSITNGNGYPVILYSDEFDYLIIEDLISGNKYDITLTYQTLIYDFDAGFSVYDRDNYKESNLILTADENGTGFESAVLNATRDGEYYVKVWINDIHGLDDSGSLDLTVIEQGTGFEMDIRSDYRIFSSLRWVWIMVGVLGGISILVIIFVYSFLFKAAKQHRLKVADAIEKGHALPRTGRKKDKCPFCGVKLPPESIVTCPYCNAPIIDE
ncbi:MAG: hypothetical protein FK731_12910 [Asgard group archaeon]|nr:hypothetical protein [Asgard group archaeon]